MKKINVIELLQTLVIAGALCFDTLVSSDLYNIFIFNCSCFMSEDSGNNRLFHCFSSLSH